MPKPYDPTQATTEAPRETLASTPPNAALTMYSTPSTHARRPIIAAISAVAVGIAFRFLWPADMEWKYDQRHMYTVAREMASGETAWPWLGMNSGVVIRNPGMSAWAFGLLALVSESPVGMVLWVIGLNVAALLGFLAFSLTQVERKHRNVWLTGVALFAVSPLAIVFSRCIWAQDLLPPLTCVILWAHAFRHRRLGALVWGGVGAILGQVHMSGFFYALALTTVTFLYDRSNKKTSAWLWWFIGSAVGALPMIPWVAYVLSQANGEGSFKLKNFYRIRFLLYFPLDALGLNIRASMKAEFLRFLLSPRVAGFPTCLVAFAHAFMAALGVCMLKRLPSAMRNIASQIRSRTYFTAGSTLRLHLTAVCVGLGLLPWVFGVTFHEHYLIVGYPFVYMWLTQALRGRTRLILSVIAAQCILSLAFLVYVHANGGVPHGDYGLTYRRQVIRASMPPPEAMESVVNPYPAFSRE